MSEQPLSRRTPTDFQHVEKYLLRRVAPPTVDLGGIRGGHCVCVYGASDRRQAVKFVNNWEPRTRSRGCRMRPSTGSSASTARRR